VSEKEHFMMHWNLRSHSGDNSSTKWYIASERKRLEEINKRIKERGRGEKERRHGRENKTKPKIFTVV
jgi:hypothetical protein